MNDRHLIIIHPPEANMGRCNLCGKRAELRPYGLKGESICFDCGMKDEKTTSAAFRAIQEG